MKLHLLFALCSVLISCLSLTVADRDRSEFHECLGQYLKSRGKLDFESSGSKKASLCNMQYLIRLIRDQFDAQVTKEYPSEASCITTEFDRNELLDIIFLFGFYITDVSEADNQSQLEGVKSEGNEAMNKITSKCGVDLEKFQEIFITALRLPMAPLAETNP